MIGKKTFVEKVANAINNNEIALFVAAGLSASTGQKNWAQMLTPCANALELEINENSDLYMIAHFLKKFLIFSRNVADWGDCHETFNTYV